jgi:hypothetical protein
MITQALKEYGAWPIFHNSLDEFQNGLSGASRKLLIYVMINRDIVKVTVVDPCYTPAEVPKGIFRQSGSVLTFI